MSNRLVNKVSLYFAKCKQPHEAITVTSALMAIYLDIQEAVVLLICR